MNGAFLQIDDKRVTAIFGARSHLQHAHGHAQGIVDRRHPAGVTAGQVVVDRHQMRAAPQQGVEVQRQGGDERLPLAGAHLGNFALVQCHAAQKLHIVGAQANVALGGFTNSGKRIRQDFIEHILFNLAALFFIVNTLYGIGNARLEAVGHCAQLIVAQLLVLWLKLVDLLDDGSEAVYLAFLGVAPQDFHKFLKHERSLPFGCGNDD